MPYVELSPGDPPPFFDNYLSRLETSAINGATAFQINAGVAADSTNAVLMRLASNYSKTTSAWAVGNGNGGLDTGSISASKWYYVFLIRRPDTGVVDVLFSLSISAPTLPASYTQFRRIGALRTSPANVFLGFTQFGDTFQWFTPTLDANASATTTPTPYALSVPVGLNVTAIFLGAITHTSVTTWVSFTTPSPVQDGTLQLGTIYMSVVGFTVSGYVQLTTNASAQINVRVGVATAGNTFLLSTLGWIDTRGKG